MTWPVPGKDPCPGVDFEGYTCGLLWDHDGEHTRYMPGCYLPAPILHPLNWLLVRVRMKSATRLCPNGCSPLRRLRTVWGDYVSDLTGISSEGWMTVHFMADERQPHVELQATVRFEPCGCEFRRLAPPEQHEAARASVMFVHG